MNARKTARRLAELEQKLEAAEKVREEIENEETTLALLKLPEAAVTELETLDIQIAKFRAIAEVGRPSVLIAYEPDAPFASLDGEPLKGGEPRSHGAQAKLAIPGVGLVTLRASLPVGSEEQLRRSEKRRRVLLASMGIDDLAAVRRKQMEAQGRRAPCAR